MSIKFAWTAPPCQLLPQKGDMFSIRTRFRAGAHEAYGMLFLRCFRHSKCIVSQAALHVKKSFEPCESPKLSVVNEVESAINIANQHAGVSAYLTSLEALKFHYRVVVCALSFDDLECSVMTPFSLCTSIRIYSAVLNRAYHHHMMGSGH